MFLTYNLEEPLAIWYRQGEDIWRGEKCLLPINLFIQFIAIDTFTTKCFEKQLRVEKSCYCQSIWCILLQKRDLPGNLTPCSQSAKPLVILLGSGGKFWLDNESTASRFPLTWKNQSRCICYLLNSRAY